MAAAAVAVALGSRPPREDLNPEKSLRGTCPPPLLLLLLRHTHIPLQPPQPPLPPLPVLRLRRGGALAARVEDRDRSVLGGLHADELRAQADAIGGAEKAGDAAAYDARQCWPEPSAASKILFTSTRSLSVSFQGESFSLPISKTKAAPSPNLSSTRKGTPERRRAATPPQRSSAVDQTENSKPAEQHQQQQQQQQQQHRWPARARPQQASHMTRSVDFSEEKRKLIGSGAAAAAAVRALRQSMIEEDRTRRASFDGRLCVDSNSSNAELVGNGSAVASDLTASDTDSVSSGSNSGAQDSGGVLVRPRNGPRGISVPARFWQETNSRLRRLQEPGSPLSKTGNASKTTAPPKLISSRKLSVDSPLASPRTVSVSRGMSSPLRGPARPVSPSKFIVSSTSSPSSRGMSSPSRVRNSISGPVASQLGNMPSLLSFAGKGKLGENRIVDAHLLRILYNRHLQWRFVNARADAAMLVQRLTAEKNLYDAWVTMSELRDSVTVKRIKLQLIRQNLKITSILRGQITYLDDWGLLDREHSSSLSGAIEALKASTLRLPVVAGARADIQNVKDAVWSAVNVMQAMASSICSLLSKGEEVNSLVTELANVTRREHDLLYQCKDILSALAAMQVKDCSMRTHILQVKRVPTRNLTTQV
ncbi:hypothetical protein Sjap_022669 [Stephania japonica]|uniref:QWRF motif-containing protein 2 n=1 Tax=Stephania japonica TaxID=461633 RepID=A0AAP0EUP7_9MAGN